MYSPEYEKRWAELRRVPLWRLKRMCNERDIFYVRGASAHEMQKDILRSEFPAEASNG